MKCKDFSVGESVIIYDRMTKHKFNGKVSKVGSKYVTTDRGYRFCGDNRFEFSMLEHDWGSTLLLFKDDMAFENYLNKIQALSEIRNMTGRYQLERYKKIYIDQILDIVKKGAKE